MIWNWIAYHARQKPKAVAVVLSGQAVTYGKFAADIARATEDLRLRLPAGAGLVGLAIDHTYLHWLATLALARLRIPSVAAVDAADLAAARPDTLIADLAIDPSRAIPVIEPKTAWTEGGADAAARIVRDRDGDYPLRLLVSSGTTGTPKRVMLSARLLEQRAMLNTVCYAITPRSRTNSQMGEGTTGGFSLPMATWRAGGVAVLAVDPLFNDKVPPALKPDFCLISPSNLDALLARTTEDAEAFPATRFLIGGGPVPQPIMERARRRLSRMTGIVYGSTEAGVISIDFSERTPFVPQAAGYVVPLAEVEVVDNSDQPVPALAQGHVRIRSSGLVDGYFEDAESTRAAFRDGWFHPGDLGVFTQQNLLVITGRSADTFNFGGVKVSPVTIEEVALAVEGVVDAGACTVTDKAGLLAIIAVKVSDGYQVDALAKAMNAKFGKFRIGIVKVARVPRNRMGKIQRQELAQMIVDQLAAAG